MSNKNIGKWSIQAILTMKAYTDLRHEQLRVLQTHKVDSLLKRGLQEEGALGLINYQLTPFLVDGDSNIPPSFRTDVHGGSRNLTR